MSSVIYNSRYLITDITTVKLIGKWIIAGVGGCIHVFETQSGKFITKEKVFEGQRVHNVFADKNQNLGIIGGKMVRIFKIEREDNFILSPCAVWTTDDWIQYLQWLDGGNLAIISAHNVVSMWNSRTGEKEKDVFCEVKCILYCALLNGSSWGELLVFAGTVFQQILVWAPSLENDTRDSPVLHTLKGHDGVIFSVSYDPECQVICSTSDDRSVRLWSVDLQLCKGSNRVTQWKEAKITLLHTMYGHTARVWRNLIIDNVIISVGEDSRLFVWNIDGSLQKCWKTHQGASVWSVDCSKEKNLIVTGGADGGISLWPLHIYNTGPNLLTFHGNLFGEDCTSTDGHNQNFPRRIGLTSKGNIVAVTDSGCLLYCTVLGGGQGNWRLVHQDKKLASYCLLEMSPCRQSVALASMDGYILVFKDCSSVEGQDLILNVEEKAVAGRIFSLHWLSSDILLSCGSHGVLEMWKLGLPHQLQKVNEFELPKSKEQWTSAAALNGNFLVCGDRNGSIHLFKIVDNQTHSMQYPSQSFYKIHGRLGVSSLIWYGNYLYSTGRDGTLRLYLMRESEGRLECLNADKLQMDWPATTNLSSSFGLLVLGFRSVNFLMWNHVERRTLLTIPCGGGHRSWDWTLEGHTFRFIYLKDKMVHIYTCVMDDLVKPVLQSGFHSKHISCVRQVPLLKADTNSNYRLLISASEDTTVRLSIFSHSDALHTVAVLTSHISSVRALAVCELDDSTLVFSGGGRAQLKVWKLVLQETQELVVPQVKCQELYSHMLRDPSKGLKKPWLSLERTVDPETRYMDLCAVAVQEGTTFLLVAGCSDGFFRIFGFYALYNELRLVGKYSFHERCILKVSLIKTESVRHVALTMATDGKVALWDLTTCVEELIGSKHSIRCHAASADTSNNTTVVATDLKPFSVIKIHQSGINSFDWIQLPRDRYLLATGGDDRAMVLSVIEIITPTVQEEMQAEVILQWRDDHAHASQITGLKIEDNVLVSTAVDQRITLWNWSCEPDSQTLAATVKARYCSVVADIQGLLTWNSGSFITACVHGKGLEVVTVQLNQGR